VLQSTVKCTTMLIEFPDDSKALVVDIAVECPLCGTIRLQLPGHHLRVIRNALIGAIDAYPELTGSDANVQQVDRFGFTSRAPQNPEGN